MSNATDCNKNTDLLKLIREGTSQEGRLAPILNPLDPECPCVDGRAIEHGVVFAQAFSNYLKYFDLDNVCVGDWQPFFSNDVSVLLAVAAVQDIAYYRQTVKEYADFLNNRFNEHDNAGLRDHLDYLFSCCATLAVQLDFLKEKLPAEFVLKKTLQTLVQSQLALALNRLIAYRKGGESIADEERPVNVNLAEKQAIKNLDGKFVPFRILGGDAVKFSELVSANLSKDWSNGADWTTYYSGIHADKTVYGAGTTVFERANHIATHNLFTSILDQFLKVFARTVGEAKKELEKSFKEWDCHEPHYALFMAFLRLFEYARTEMNTLTGRHLDFYYREILRLKEKGAKPGHAHLLVELAKQDESREFKTGVLFKAGKDDLGRDAFFANDRDFVANQAKVAAFKTVYLHKNSTKDETLLYQNDRLFASPIANSDDGLGAKLVSVDQSWHPFYNKIYPDGKLSEIRMPKAEVGFAIASHYLWMAEGTRIVTVAFNVSITTAVLTEFKDDVVCLFTGKKGWFEVAASKFRAENGTLKLEITLSGADPAVVPYIAKTHGNDFATNLPVLLVKLRHRDESEYVYSHFKDVVLEQIDLTVDVTGLKTLAVSNDFGPVDTSKPFQPFGASPVANGALVIGSKEVFQKNLSTAIVNVKWQNAPDPYPSGKKVNVITSYLQSGVWQPSSITQQDITIVNDDFTPYSLSEKLSSFIVDEPDLTVNEQYSTVSRNGFVRLKLDEDFGQSGYEEDLSFYIKKLVDKTLSSSDCKPIPPIGPFISELAMHYIASQAIDLKKTDKSGKAFFEKRQARFFHVAPFGQAEQHPFLNSAQKVFLLPQFDFKRDDANQESEAAEFYIGVTGLMPPQNLALLFQVADGTADPLSKKPDSHIHWSYLGGNEWLPFAKSDVEDRTGGLLNSGIITFAVPRDASAANTLLPTGMYWIRAAVASETDAVCRLRMVAAQALAATFTDKGNDSAFPAKVLQSGTISKLDQPVAAVKKIIQPFETFGGRGKEAPAAFYTRVSERLRHKDRAIALWDYERLILEAYPQIYKVKCLNHTQYEPGKYRELAPGHVTVVTIPNQQFHNLHDPLQPYTSLSLLKEIDSFLSKRLSCFIELHVCNPEVEEVQVNCNVRLYEEFDETFYVNELKKAITRFLSPWAFPGGGRPTFGGKVYKSVLINFVEDLPYVDYVTDFQLLLDGAAQTEVVEGSKAVSILVSARDHVINPIKPAEVEAPPGKKCQCEA